jgi:type VI secretion system secreted protein Hcp
MAFMAYMTINGSKQGRFKGNSGKSGRHGWIEVLSCSYSVQSPRDAATGQASGKRVHKPVQIVAEWGTATPQLFQALVSNEVLAEVTIDFVDTNKDGKSYVRQTKKLVNATISSLRSQAIFSNGPIRHGHSLTLDEYLEIDMTFHPIEWTWKNGGKTYSDDWQAGS